MDINDLTIVLAHYNQTVGSSAGPLAAVPEPPTLVLFIAIGLVACGWLRRSQGGAAAGAVHYAVGCVKPPL